MEDRLTKKIDVLIFNPPYVPTESNEIGGNGIEASWAGGIDGREVIDRLLPKFKVRWNITYCFHILLLTYLLQEFTISPRSMLHGRCERK